MKRFVIGFLVGIGLMYLYLYKGDTVQTEVSRWLHGAASKYRGDTEHQAAGEAFGGSEHRP
ncbi:MAG: hypothetical protein ABSA52_13920 [Candidatus Binatia bacterium]|jgi:hypothetical protein